MTITMRPIEQNIWHVEHPFRLLAMEIGIRMTVVRLPSSELLVHSPVPFDERLKKKMISIGRVAYIVAPNLFHNLFVKGWQEAFPDARTYAPPGLKAKCPHIRVDEELLRGKTYPWSEHLDHDVVEGVPKSQESVFFHRASKTLIVTDLLFNFQADKAMGRWQRLILTLNKAASGPACSRLYRSLVKDRDAMSKSLARIVMWDFDKIALAHGAMIQKEGREVFEGVFREYLTRKSGAPPAPETGAPKTEAPKGRTAAQSTKAASSS